MEEKIISSKVTPSCIIGTILHNIKYLIECNLNNTMCYINMLISC